MKKRKTGRAATIRKAKGGSIQRMTKLQMGTVITGMVLFTVWGVSSMEAHGSDSRPSESLFENSQTVSVLES